MHVHIAGGYVKKGMLCEVMSSAMGAGYFCAVIEVLSKVDLEGEFPLLY